MTSQRPLLDFISVVLPLLETMVTTAPSEPVKSGISPE